MELGVFFCVDSNTYRICIREGAGCKSGTVVERKQIGQRRCERSGPPGFLIGEADVRYTGPESSALPIRKPHPPACVHSA